MYRKFVALTFLSFFLLAGCSDSSDDDSDLANATDATDATDTTAVLLATADKSGVRVNGVRVYTNSVPTRISTFGSDGALAETSQIAIDIDARTFTEVAESVNDSDEAGASFQTTSVASFNEFGQLAVIESSDTEDGNDESELLARVDFVYEGEQVTTLTSNIFDGPVSNIMVEDRFNFDDNGRVVGGSRFFQGELLREWTREYNDFGWVETEGEVGDQLTNEVSVNDDGLIERVVTTESEFSVFTEIQTYDEQERLIQVEVLSNSGQLVVRIEYRDFQDTNVYWHDVVNSIEASSLFRE